MIQLSVVIPAYNEGRRIDSTIEAIKQFLIQKRWEYEIIVVNDGSSDDTPAVVERSFGGFGERCQLLSNATNRGKGYSVKRGMLGAKGEYVLFTDADLSTPIAEAEKLLEPLKNGFDLAIGSRALRESKVEIHQNWVREAMGKIFNCFARLLTFKGIYDSQCGFKCFKREAAQKLFSMQKIDGFTFDAEIIYLAQKLGYRIKEVPVIWRNSPSSKVRIFSDPLKMFLDLTRIRMLHFRR